MEAENSGTQFYLDILSLLAKLIISLTAASLLGVQFAHSLLEDCDKLSKKVEPQLSSSIMNQRTDVEQYLDNALSSAQVGKVNFTSIKTTPIHPYMHAYMGVYTGIQCLTNQ